MKVLIVDDSQTTREQLKQSLEHIDPFCEIIEASRGKLGWSFIETYVPDLVLLDMVLPDLPGATILKTVRDIPQLSHVKVIIITGSGGPLDRERWKQLGSDGFLVKPVYTAELKREIEQVMATPSDEPADTTNGHSTNGNSVFL